MALPGQLLHVSGGGGGSKRTRHRNPADVTASKRRKHALRDQPSATRPLTSVEQIWGTTAKSSLYCSEKDKGTFGISFERRQSESEAASRYQATQLSTAKMLKCYWNAKLPAVKALLGPYDLWSRERGQGRRLQLRYGYATSVVATDAVFRNPSTVPEVAYIDFAQLRHRKDMHIISLLRKAEKEEEQNRARIAEEQRRIKPKKAEEDAQIALIMAAMAQEMLRSGEPHQMDAWVKVIGISKSEIFLYQALVPKKFVQTFDASEGFVIKYRSASLNDQNGVLQKLDLLLREKRPPRDQPGVAEQAKC